MKKYILGVFLLVVALSVSGCFKKTAPQTEENQENSTVEQETQQEEQSQGYTLVEVEAHATGEDCWMAVDGKVYDITEFIAGGKHGGGDAVLEGCGKDATELYNTRPMGSGTPHSEMARGFLENYYIGDLVE